jgi:hypothetical protein
MLEHHPLLIVRDCLFNIIAATLHIWRKERKSKRTAKKEIGKEGRG